MSKATVVSLFPFALGPELKPGLIPTGFYVPPAVQTGPGIADIIPSVLLIEKVERVIYLDNNRPSLRVLEPSEKIAESVVGDFINSCIHVTPGTATPGIFWVDGVHNEVQTKVLPEYRTAFERQHNYYVNLVTIADDLWVKYKQHRSISDVQRHAAKILGYKREWTLNSESAKVQTCPACGSLVPYTAVVCKSCQLILDEARYKDLKFAKVS